MYYVHVGRWCRCDEDRGTNRIDRRKRGPVRNYLKFKTGDSRLQTVQIISRRDIKTIWMIDLRSIFFFFILFRSILSLDSFLFDESRYNKSLIFPPPLAIELTFESHIMIENAEFTELARFLLSIWNHPPPPRKIIKVRKGEWRVRETGSWTGRK